MHFWWYDHISHETPPCILTSCLTDIKEEILRTELVKTACPLTGQPDYASVQITYQVCFIQLPHQQQYPCFFLPCRQLTLHQNIVLINLDQGPAIDHTALLLYFVSFRNHNDFHENCVEQMFTDIMKYPLAQNTKSSYAEHNTTQLVLLLKACAYLIV